MHHMQQWSETGKTSRVNSESLVLDDIVIFKAGNQVCADAEVVHGSAGQ